MNEAYFITREDLMAVFPARAARQFETMQEQVAATGATVSANVDRTGRLEDATFVTLSPNDALPNERVLKLGAGLKFGLDGGEVSILLDGVPRSDSSFRVQFVVAGDTELALPLTGFLATRDNVETLTNKTLAAPKMGSLANATDDAAAATAGVPVGGVYRNGSALRVRVA